jgi:hypothetical protein
MHCGHKWTHLPIAFAAHPVKTHLNAHKLFRKGGLLPFLGTRNRLPNDENKSRRCTHYRKVKSAELYGIMREERRGSLYINFSVVLDFYLTPTCEDTGSKQVFLLSCLIKYILGRTVSKIHHTQVCYFSFLFSKLMSISEFAIILFLVEIKSITLS